MLDRLSKQLEKMLILLGKLVMYLTHVFMELQIVLGGLKGRKTCQELYLENDSILPVLQLDNKRLLKTVTNKWMNTISVLLSNVQVIYPEVTE